MCLESLYQITYLNYDVIIVGNDSKDESIQKIKEYAEGKIEVSGFERGSKMRMNSYLCKKLRGFMWYTMHPSAERFLYYDHPQPDQVLMTLKSAEIIQRNIYLASILSRGWVLSKNLAIYSLRCFEKVECIGGLKNA